MPTSYSLCLAPSGRIEGLPHPRVHACPDWVASHDRVSSLNLLSGLGLTLSSDCPAELNSGRALSTRSSLCVCYLPTCQPHASICTKRVGSREGSPLDISWPTQLPRLHRRRLTVAVETDVAPPLARCAAAVRARIGPIVSVFIAFYLERYTHTISHSLLNASLQTGPLTDDGARRRLRPL